MLRRSQSVLTAVSGSSHWECSGQYSRAGDEQCRAALRQYRLVFAALCLACYCCCCCCCPCDADIVLMCLHCLPIPGSSQHNRQRSTLSQTNEELYSGVTNVNVSPRAATDGVTYFFLTTFFTHRPLQVMTFFRWCPHHSHLPTSFIQCSF